MISRLKHWLRSAVDAANKHALVVFIVSAVVAAFVLVAVALHLYRTSGSLQLDLSRPGYENVRQEAKDESPDSYPATGTLDRAAAEDFMDMLDRRIRELDTVDAFGGDGMTDAALGIDDAPQQ